jgi:hypothetical protein
MVYKASKRGYRPGGAAVNYIGLDGQREFQRFCNDFTMARLCRQIADQRVKEAKTLDEAKSIVQTYVECWNYGGPWEIRAPPMF